MMYISGFRRRVHDVYYDVGRAGDGVSNLLKAANSADIPAAHRGSD